MKIYTTLLALVLAAGFSSAFAGSGSNHGVAGELYETNDGDNIEAIAEKNQGENLEAIGDKRDGKLEKLHEARSADDKMGEDPSTYSPTEDA